MVVFSDLVGFAASAIASLQRPLIEVAEKTYGIPLIATPTMLEDWVHFQAIIGVGSDPGHLLRAMVDINAAGTYIESTQCRTSRWCCPLDFWQYNHTLSKSYQPNGTAVSSLYWGAGPEVNGTLSYDTLRLSDDLEIPDHVFIETVSRYARLPDQWDTILGLSPSRLHYRYREMKTNVSIPGVFEELVTLNAADKEKRNVFSLLSPYYPGHLGDLSFGTHHDDLYEGELVKHPLYPPGADTWQIRAPDVKLRSKDGDIIYEEANDGGRVAHLDSTLPGIYFPSGSNVTAHIGSQGIDQSCASDALDQLPDMILNFDGQEVVLTARDYHVLAHDLWGTFRCRLMVAEEGDFVDTRGNDAITLGTDFLKVVYAVFDWDERTISFAKPRRDIELPIAKAAQRPPRDDDVNFPRSCFDWR